LIAQSTKQALLLQLCAVFRARYWWMASFVLVRRLVLVALLVSVRSSSVWIWLSLVNQLALALHLKTEPFERPMDNSLESLTLLSLALQTTLLSVWRRRSSAPPSCRRSLRWSWLRCSPSLRCWSALGGGLFRAASGAASPHCKRRSAMSVTTRTVRRCESNSAGGE
jgi:hypothetical protein